MIRVNHLFSTLFAEKKKSRGFGFLSFEDEMSRERAVSDHFVTIQNKQVSITWNPTGILDI